MAAPIKRSDLRKTVLKARREAVHLLRRLSTIVPALWPIAVVVGIITGYAVIGFRVSISALQTMFYGADDITIHSVAANLPWYIVLFLPIIGGLVVGWILSVTTPDGKARGVSDVIQAAAVRSGRIERRPGIGSAAAALVTLSTGGSTGREGPAIHIGAVIASWVSERIKASDITARDILGCGAAAAVSASFNAPLAGTLFALEVILRHYALHAFGPIVLASVAGAIVSRIHLGDVTEFNLPADSVEFYWEIPAFFMLGLISGIVAVAMMRGVFVAESTANWVQKRCGIPNWLRPAIAGVLLGLIALKFPHIIGVGYETTNNALRANIAIEAAILLAIVKVLAVAITFSGRMGGGIFSPALMLGALTGCAFGEIAIGVFPSVSGSQSLYSLAGMGAVAGAVLGAPISTTLIVFELTGDFQVAIAVMISVAVASVVSDKLATRSFFLTQLEHQGLQLSDGPQGYIAATVPVISLMRIGDARASAELCREMHEQGLCLNSSATLASALPMFDQTREVFIPVINKKENADEPEFIGAIFRGDAFKAYSEALEEELKEEHS
ncbi:chloride channel protein [Rhodobacteraceae bacterium NNCM2]|nr:chloride channel protein [Coraliihabitans acroporae]